MVPKLIARGWLCWLLAAGILPAGGATRVWIGAQNGLWSNPANWTNGIVPKHLDSIEFPADAAIRDTVNDFESLSLGSITFTGGRYTVSGFKLYLDGGIVSLPGNTTNHVACDIFVNKPQSFVCFSYFNELAFSGEIELGYPLRLETSSTIRISGRIWRGPTSTAEVTQASSGRVSFGAFGYTEVPYLVERGLLDLYTPSLFRHVRAPLTVGVEELAMIDAYVSWGAADKVTPGVGIVVNRTGQLNLNGFNQALAGLGGSGVVEFGGGKLTLSVPWPWGTGGFAGRLRGAGTLRLEGMNHWELSGNSGLTGVVEVAARELVGEPPVASQLILSGSLSNAVVQLSGQSALTGNGTAKGLVASQGMVRPGPGTLRFLEEFKLDNGSTLSLTLDGTETGQIEAESINLGDAALELTYHGFGTESLFALISANANSGSQFNALPEGNWIVAGDPGAPSEFRLTYSGNGGHDVVLERTGWFVPPTLSIRLSGIERVIAWPVAAQGYSLQRSLSLDPPAWTSDGLPAPDATATDFFVIDDSTDGGRFYRLVR